jgi:hypothetical protein
VDGQHPRPAVKDGDDFQIACTGELRKQFIFGARCLSVTVGQRVCLNGTEKIWDSVGVYAERQPDGTLVVRVVVFSPDWDEPLQIACLRSRPEDATCLTALGCNLNHATA